MKNLTPIEYRFKPEQLTGYAMDNDTTFETLRKFGISFSKEAFGKMQEIYNLRTAQDEAPGMITTPTNLTPIQFLQFINPSVVTMLTTKTDIDELVGFTKAGSWEDEEIVQQFVELLGSARPYGDKANPTLASFNNSFEKRTVVRFEASFETGILETARAARIKLNTHDVKKRAAARVLEIGRNIVGYNGYVEGDNKTYGLLNDPNLPAYQTVATGASASTLWKDKTYSEICADLVTAISRLQVQTGNNYNPYKDRASLFVSVAAVQFLSTQNSLGTKTVKQWLAETYPLIDVKASAWLDEANGGANVFYLVVDYIDGDKTIDQYVPEKMRFLGIWNKGKNVEEFYANATAGVMVRIPVGTVRYTGI